MQTASRHVALIFEHSQSVSQGSSFVGLRMSMMLLVVIFLFSEQLKVNILCMVRHSDRPGIAQNLMFAQSVLPGGCVCSQGEPDAFTFEFWILILRKRCENQYCNSALVFGAADQTKLPWTAPSLLQRSLAPLFPRGLGVHAMDGPNLRTSPSINA